MPRICSNDARMRIYGFKNRAWHRDTYRAFEGLRTRAFDPGRLTEHPGIDWYNFLLLETSFAMISNSNFLPLFQVLVLSILAASNPYFVPCGLLMYYGMH